MAPTPWVLPDEQSLGGCERFHGAVIAHDGTEESRVFKETAALGEELDRIGRRLWARASNPV